jgi:2-iminobutanoate/2-iminopropanoate deaminase
MPTRTIESSTVRKPSGSWNSAFEISRDSRLVVTGGVAGFRLDGSFDVDIAEQTKQMFKNLIAILQEADMTMDNVVRLTSYLVDMKNFEAYKIARAPFLGNRRPAATLIAINALPQPGILVEIEVIAAA